MLMTPRRDASHVSTLVRHAVIRLCAKVVWLVGIWKIVSVWLNALVTRYLCQAYAPVATVHV